MQLEQRYTGLHTVPSNGIIDACPEIVERNGKRAESNGIMQP